MMFAAEVTPDVADWWIQKTAVYGLAFVFTACVLGLLIWLAMSLVNMLKIWIPRWFQSSIDSHTKVAVGVDRLTETLSCIHDQTQATRRGLSNLADAGTAFLERNKERLGVSSDVVLRVKDAQRTLKNGDCDAD
jgi:hypothetical protein